jgi:hypothetical protein
MGGSAFTMCFGALDVWFWVSGTLFGQTTPAQPLNITPFPSKLFQRRAETSKSSPNKNLIS